MAFMIKLNYTTIATGASIDNSTGNVTLFNLIEEIRIPKDRMPVAIPELAFVGSFTRLDPSISQMKFKLEYLQPQGKTLPINESATVFQGDRMRVVIRLNGMPIDHFGRHKLRLIWNWGSSDDTEGSFDIFLDAVEFEVTGGNPIQN